MGEATRSRRWAAVLLVAAAVLLLASTAAQAATVSLFPVPTPDAGLSSIAEGPNGNLWFTESNDVNVSATPYELGEISSTTGQITDIPMHPLSGSTGEGDGPTAITASGNTMWFLSDLGGALYKVAPGASSPTQVGATDIYDPEESLATDDAGGVWATLGTGTLGGATSELRHYLANGTEQSPIGAQYGGEYDPVPIISDGAGGVWYADDGDYLRHQPASGTSVSYPANSPYSFYDVTSMASDGQGDLYFTEYDGTADGMLPSGGALGELPAGSSAAQTADFGDESEVMPSAMTPGPDGALWFATSTGVGRFDPSTGQTDLATIPDISITDMAFASDGNLWFIDAGANDVGRIITSTIFPPATPTPTPNPAPTLAPSPTPTPTPTPTKPRAPKVHLVVSATRLQTIGRTDKFVIDCRLAAAGRCSADVAVTAKVARSLGVKVTRNANSATLAQASHEFKKPGAAPLTLRFAAKLARRIARRHTLVLALTVSSSAAGDRTRMVHQQLTLRRRRPPSPSPDSP